MPFRFFRTQSYEKIDRLNLLQRLFEMIGRVVKIAHKLKYNRCDTTSPQFSPEKPKVTR